MLSLRIQYQNYIRNFKTVLGVSPLRRLGGGDRLNYYCRGSAEPRNFFKIYSTQLIGIKLRGPN